MLAQMLKNMVAPKIYGYHGNELFVLFKTF